MQFHIEGAREVTLKEIKNLFPPRKRETHKGDYGSACIVAGSDRFLGAPVMSVAAALVSGCGYVYACVPQSIKCAMAVAYPQCIYIDQPLYEASAIAVGMGMGCSEMTYRTVCFLLENYTGKLIVDADGLNSLAKFGCEPLIKTQAQVLLTPHVGEMARLAHTEVGEVLSAPVKVAQSFAREYNVVVHLKNAASVTCTPVGATFSARGNSALAKAGSGDILSGLICGGAARGLSLAEAAVGSQYLLGTAAEICSEKLTEYSVTAENIISDIGVALKRLTDTK